MKEVERLDQSLNTLTASKNQGEETFKINERKLQGAFENVLDMVLALSEMKENETMTVNSIGFNQKKRYIMKCVEEILHSNTVTTTALLVKSKISIALANLPSNELVL